MPAASGTAAAQPSFQHSKPKPHTSVPGQAKQKQEDLAWTRTTGLWAPASSALPRSSGIASRDTRETSVSWCNHSGSTATEFETPQERSSGSSVWTPFRQRGSYPFTSCSGTMQTAVVQTGEPPASCLPWTTLDVHRLLAAFCLL